MKTFRLTILAGLIVGVSPAFAQSPSPIGTFRDWSAFSYTDGGAKVCYAASQPKNQEPKNVNRDPVFFLITTRPADKVREQASIIIGYPFKADSKVTVEVDGQKFELFTKEDGAWIDDAQEPALIQALKRGQTMVVKGTSHRGTLTTDTYSLLGISAALDTVNKTCP